MRHIAHLVAIAQSDDVLEVVLDDAEVVAVIADVGRQQQRVAPADDPLLALVGRAPIDFERELVGLEDARRLGEPLTQLAEEFNRSDPAKEAKPCAFVRVNRVSSGVGLTLLSEGWTDEGRDGPRPVIWSPAVAITAFVTEISRRMPPYLAIVCSVEAATRLPM